MISLAWKNVLKKKQSSCFMYHYHDYNYGVYNCMEKCVFPSFILVWR